MISPSATKTCAAFTTSFTDQMSPMMRLLYEAVSGAHSQTDCRVAVDACLVCRGVVWFRVVVCLCDGTHRGRDHSAAGVRFRRRRSTSLHANDGGSGDVGIDHDDVLESPSDYPFDVGLGDWPWI